MRHGRGWFLAALGGIGIATAIMVVIVSDGRARSAAPRPLLVPVISTDDVLRQIRAGKHVVFVDARETAEFQEEHIPGAVNIPLREVSRLDRRLLGDPDLVIAYCLKDFRGFEVARALNAAGLRDARILSEFGIKGWKSKGLPTWLAGTSPAAAVTALQACALNSKTCGAGTGGVDRP